MFQFSLEDESIAFIWFACIPNKVPGPERGSGFLISGIVFVKPSGQVIRNPFVKLACDLGLENINEVHTRK